MTPLARSMSVVFIVMLSYVPMGRADGSFTAPADAKILVQCECVAATTGCQSKVFDSLSGKQRVAWTQEAQAKKGVVYNLNQLCYRKRDVKGAGDELCCEVPGDETATTKNLFRGTVR